MLKSTALKTIVFVFGYLCLSCNTEKVAQQQNQADEELPVVTLISKDTVLYREYVTNVSARRNVEIRARIEGFLEKIMVDEGQYIKKGQAMFAINNEEQKAELAKAQANLTSAVANAKSAALETDQVRLLVAKDVVSKSELEVAKAKLTAATARIKEAQSAQDNAAIKLSYTYIKAPFDGVLDRIPLKAGSLVDKGTLLTTISDAEEVYAYFNVSEAEYLNYVKQMNGGNPSSRAARLILADGSLYNERGKIETMEGQFDIGTGTIAFRAKFPNPKQLLKHGSSGKVRLSNKIQDALLLPQKAAFEVQDKNYVFVVNDSNIVQMRSFEPQYRLDDFYIVKSGLKPGDRVVYEGIQGLRDGNKIKPQPVEMKKLLSQTLQKGGYRL